MDNTTVGELLQRMCPTSEVTDIRLDEEDPTIIHYKIKLTHPTPPFILTKNEEPVTFVLDGIE